MNFEITQSLQQKLQRRIERLRNTNILFVTSIVKQLFAFIESETTLKSILEEIEAQFTLEEKETFLHSFNYDYNSLMNISNENESIKFSTSCLRFLSNTHYSRVPEIAEKLGMREDNLYLRNQSAVTYLFENIFQPFCDYFIEQLDSQKAMLSLLYRYKHRCEWFKQERLFQLYKNETQKGEKLLALDLYGYLFEQGINFTIEPSSIDGAIDLISAQNSDDPLLADAKIFKGDKSYICKGFGQLYSYTKKYNEPFGYLVIYNTTEKDISFLFSNSTGSIPFVSYNHKTIFLITIDLYKHSEPPSKRGLVKPVEIKEEDLFEFVNSES